MDCSTPGLPAAAAAAKSLQLCPTLCSPIDGSPPAPPSQDSQVTNTGVGCHFLLRCMKVKSENEVAQWCLTLYDPMNRSTPGLPAAAAAAKSLQLCPTLCDAVDGSPPGSPVPGILQTRTLEWVAISFSNA